MLFLSGTVNNLQPLLEVEAHRQQLTKAKQVVWISDGARGFWRLFERCFAAIAIGILDFYHATEHLYAVAEAYGSTVKKRTPQQCVYPLAASVASWLCAYHILSEFAALLTLCIYSRGCQAKTAASTKLFENSSATLAVPTVQKAGIADGFWHGGERL